MGRQTETGISWCDFTFNGWEGCNKISPGCDHCYAEARNSRFGGGSSPNWGLGAPRRRTSEANWRKPIKWNNTPFYECAECGWRGFENERSFKQTDTPACGDCWSLEIERARPRVFCASLADVFDNEVSWSWRYDLFELIQATPNLDWLILTKRIGNVDSMVHRAGIPELPENVWLGATIVNQEEAERDIPKLLKIPASVRFLSVEPMLQPIQIRRHIHRSKETGPDRQFSDRLGIRGRIHWVICGGESGPGARPMGVDWAESLRNQCNGAGVPFFMKQMGGPVKRSMPVIPPDLMIREFPK